MLTACHLLHKEKKPLHLMQKAFELNPQKLFSLTAKDPYMYHGNIAFVFCMMVTLSDSKKNRPAKTK